MRNVSMWVLVLVLALVGSAIWHEVQFRHAAPGSNSRIKRASMKEAAPEPIDNHNTRPTNEQGQLIG